MMASLYTFTSLKIVDPGPASGWFGELGKRKAMDGVTPFGADDSGRLFSNAFESLVRHCFAGQAE